MQTKQLTIAQHAMLVEKLGKPDAWPEHSGPVEVIETHISSVFLLGDHAYKLKKPLDLGFLDFSTLAKRRHYCREELRLNRRLAPDIYLAVVPVTGTIQQPVPGGRGTPIDWLVKMRRFDADGLLADHPGLVSGARVRDLADQIAKLHRQSAGAETGTGYGSPQQVIAAMRENFSQLHNSSPAAGLLSGLAELENRTEEQFRACRDLLEQRGQQGHVRECHGDLHLGNITVHRGNTVIFDGIEFAPEFRWIDTLSDIAFLVMDLQHHQLAGKANLLLNDYLERNGDYAGLPLLNFYLVYRAMVRAKVTAIHLGQPGLSGLDRASLQAECKAYLQCAKQAGEKSMAGLLITHGVSGSGKTSATRALLEQLPVIRVRSDIERKRLAEIMPTERVEAGNRDSLYAPATTERTYSHLLGIAETILDSGRIALVDATFLDAAQRQKFHRLALRKSVPFLIMSFDATPSVLRSRLQKRTRDNNDASDAGVNVMEQQRASRDPLSEEERKHEYTVAADGIVSASGLINQLGLNAAVWSSA